MLLGWSVIFTANSAARKFASSDENFELTVRSPYAYLNYSCELTLWTLGARRPNHKPALRETQSSHIVVPKPRAVRRSLGWERSLDRFEKAWGTRRRGRIDAPFTNFACRSLAAYQTFNLKLPWSCLARRGLVDVSDLCLGIRYFDAE
jgi:hypothetical protein